MNESSKPQKTDRKQYSLNLLLAAVTGQVGCLTVIVIIVATFLGLKLDNMFDTRPIITFVLVFVSVPITLFLMFWVIRWTTSKMVFSEPENKTPQEEEDVGRSDT